MGTRHHRGCVRFALVVGFCGGLGWTVPSMDAAAETIPIANPEDILPVPDGRFAIVSRMADHAMTNGEIVAVDTRHYTMTRIFPNDESNHPAPAGSACPGAPAPGVFSPHGIALGGAGAETRLYVVNHGGRETIEVFAVDQDDGALHVTWTDCVPLPDGATANSVAVAGNTLFISNNGKALDGDKVDPNATDILRWRADQGWTQVIPGHFATPNGLIASPAGDRLYVALWTGREVIELRPDAEATVHRRVSVDFLPDNVHWDKDGALLVAGQITDPINVADCYYGKFDADKACPITGAIARIDPETMTVICHRTFPPTETFGPATTAVPVGESLWLGQTRGHAVLVVPRLSEPGPKGGC